VARRLGQGEPATAPQGVEAAWGGWAMVRGGLGRCRARQRWPGAAGQHVEGWLVAPPRAMGRGGRVMGGAMRRGVEAAERWVERADDGALRAGQRSGDEQRQRRQQSRSGGDNSV
jgi:hypothetical protein